MAILEHRASGTQHRLAPRNLVGRAPACQLRIEEAKISGYHAEILWDGQRWCVRDLGSRNGTALAGQPLERDVVAGLPREAELVFAEVAHFRLIDDSPPHLFATSETGQVRVAEDDLLCLPSDEWPELTLYLDLDGRWWVEDVDETRVLAPLDTLIAGARSWRVSTPQSIPGTAEADGAALLAQHELRFGVSRDEEHVELELVAESGTKRIEPRVHLFLLLTLARARLNDRAQAELPEAERGWIYREDLPQMLGIQPPALNLWIHRARKQLARAGIRDAAALVERRAGGTQLRIGTARLAVS